MVSYRISHDVLALVERQSIDIATHEAIRRYGDELGENRQLAAEIARHVARSAVEQFKTFCNHELGLLEIEHKRRADLLMMQPPPSIFTGDKQHG